jgi:hypothetical protein
VLATIRKGEGGCAPEKKAKRRSGGARAEADEGGRKSRPVLFVCMPREPITLAMLVDTHDTSHFSHSKA